jgi:gliding motility-associated-like protein
MMFPVLRNTLFSTLILLITALSPAKGQLQADFSASTTEGCNPVSVEFTDQSSGNVTSYEWDFGNGNTSTKADPGATYVNAGVYNVTLVVRNGNQSDTITKTNLIEVYEPPESGFQATPKQGCLPLDVNFQEDAKLGDAPIRDYIWDFGDGGSSSGANPGHRYRQEGTFSVSLIVRDTNGCQDVVSKQDLIATSQVPTADFSTQNSNACEPPAVARFTNQSSGQQPLSYEWDFGDGNTDTAENPTNAYQQNGNYDVSLIVTNATGCSDTITKQSAVRIQPFTGDFSLNQREGCTNPVTTFQFTDQSSPSPTFQKWDFGDGSTSSQPDPSKQYLSKGIYPVTYVSGFGSCRDTLRDTIRVQQISASIQADTLNSCRAPLTVDFSSLTTNVDSQSWKFGDGSTSSQPNPIHTYSNTGTYPVTLQAESPIGCQVTKQGVQVTIENPLAGFSFTPQANQGCKDRIWTFNDTSSIPGFEQLTARKWRFGTADSSTSARPSYQFPDTGDYEVSLAIETSGGCTDTARQQFFIGDTPTYNLQVDTNVFCATEDIEFPSNTDFADSSRVTFKRSIESSFKPLQEDPIYSYEDTGWFQVYGQAFFNGCPSGVDSADSIYINPPVADFKSTVACDSPFKRTFTDGSIEPDTWRWDFGNGDTSRVQNPEYRYDTQQRFNVELIVENDSTGCRDTQRKAVFIEEVKAKFSVSDTIGCPPLQGVRFDASASENVSGRNYYWNFRNGNVLNKTDPPEQGTLVQPPPQTFERSDSFPVRLYVRDRNLCRDTAIRYVRVYQHDTRITTERLQPCVPTEIAFGSEIEVDTPLTKKEWTFGDNSPPVQGDSPRHTYNQTGSYEAELSTADENGCTATVTKTIGVTKPQVFFQAFDRELCRDEQVRLEAQRSNQPLDYQWFFGDGDSAQGNAVQKSYAQNGKYDITLIGKDTNQCSDTLVRDQYLEVRSPNAAFAMNDTAEFCPPFVAEFYDSSAGQNLDYQWDFGNGSQSVLEEPQNTYTIVDTFGARLEVTNDIGCTNADSQQVVLEGPIARFDAIPDSGCKPLDYEFQAFDKRGVDEIRWDFGDGATATGDTVTHPYRRGGTYFPVILVDNGQEGTRKCEYGIQLSDTIRVDTHNAAFEPGKPEYCIYEDVAFDNQTEGTISAYEWRNLSNGAVDSGQLPDFTFNDTQTYDLKLVTTNYKGCKDSARLQFPVHPKPSVAAEDSTFICQGEQAQLNATFDTSFTYQWKPAGSLSAPEAYNPLAGPEQTTDYTVRVTDGNGCKDTSSPVQIEVQPEPAPVASPDTTIILGDSVQLQAEVATPIQSLEWSPTDSLRCINCPDPIARPFSQQTYTVEVQDTAGCFTQQDQVTIRVDERFKIAVPEAFTPNGDAINDIIRVRGWGVNELIHFRVYNRWGELVYEARDIEEGWDGQYQGEPLPPGTYTYQVKARSYTGKVGTDKGHFNLIR